MNDDVRFLIAVGFAATVISALMVMFGMWLKPMQCEQRWQRSGMQSEWTLVQGCMVQRKDGTWVPASAYRELGQ